MAERHAIKRLVWEALFYAALLLLLVSIVFPFYWMVKTSIETGQGLFSYPPRLLPATYSIFTPCCFSNGGMMSRRMVCSNEPP